jgi:hypothetical protein
MNIQPAKMHRLLLSYVIITCRASEVEYHATLLDQCELHNHEGFETKDEDGQGRNLLCEIHIFEMSGPLLFA